MKKIILSFLFSSIVCYLTAQNITVGVIGAFNNTWIFNEHVSIAPAGAQDYFPSFGGSFGVSGAVFIKRIGFEVDAMYATHNQNYNGDGSFPAAGKYESAISFKRIDIPVMFKVKSEHGAFFEIGPQFTLISKPTYEISREGDPNLILKLNDTDSLRFSSSAIDAVLGVGVEVDLFWNFSFSTELRCNVGLSDLRGVNALGQDLVKMNPYYRTWAASAGLFLGITWRLGKKDLK